MSRTLVPVNYTPDQRKHGWVDYCAGHDENATACLKGATHYVRDDDTNEPLEHLCKEHAMAFLRGAR